jgi:hypothetical protein
MEYKSIEVKKYRTPEAEFLDKIQTTVLRDFPSLFTVTSATLP